MAKTIKFNLICDGYPARTIEDLQNHFSVEDMLDYYENGLLAKWLEVRGFSRELEYVRMISDRDPLRIIEELIRIFDIEENEAKIRETISYLKLKKKKEEASTSYRKVKNDENSILCNYHKNYTSLISGLLSAKNDVPVIKSHIRELATNYYEILKLVYRDLFYAMYEESCWLGIMLLLANEKTRDFYIPTMKERLGNLSHKYESILIRNLIHTDDFSSHKYKDKKDIFNLICNWIHTDVFSNAMGEHLKRFSANTNGKWKNIESKGQDYMIIRMHNSIHVRSAGRNDEDLEYYDIANKFVILNGIDYKSDKPADVLFYMEV